MRRVFLALTLILTLLGSSADIARDKAFAEEKIILKNVPYFHQKERLD